MDEYGFDADSITKLDGAFWSHVKTDGAYVQLRDALATKRLPVHVTKHVRSLNRNRTVGHGATKCKFARPRIELPRNDSASSSSTSLKQSKLSAFF